MCLGSERNNHIDEVLDAFRPHIDIQLVLLSNRIVVLETIY